MWDGNCVADHKQFCFMLLSENQCGMETTGDFDISQALGYVEREPMWDGNTKML